MADKRLEKGANEKKQAFNNKNLVQKLRLEMNFSEADAKKIVELMVNSMRDSLLDGRPVRLNPIGTLKPYTLEHRRQYNPHTKTTMDLTARRKVKFQIGAQLKREMNPDVEQYKIDYKKNDE